MEREPKKKGSVKIGVLIKTDDDWLEEMEDVEDRPKEEEWLEDWLGVIPPPPPPPPQEVAEEEEDEEGDEEELDGWEEEDEDWTEEELEEELEDEEETTLAR